MPPPSLTALLKTVVEQEGDELHLSANTPATVRINGQLFQLNLPPLSPFDLQRYSRQLMLEENERELQSTGKTKFSFGIKGLGRFDAVCYLQQQQISAVFRHVKSEIRTFRELGLPAELERELEQISGLGLISGPPDSGRSTTMAALIDKINRERNIKVLNLWHGEQLFHSHHHSLIEHVKLGKDLTDIDDVMSLILDTRANVVSFDGIYDVDGLRQILHAADCGFLVLATVTGTNAASALRAMVERFPPHHQYSARRRLAQSLSWIVSQRLLPHVNGKRRVLIMEALKTNVEVEQLIRANQWERLATASRTYRTGGMLSMNRSLAEAYFKRIITLQTAFQQSPDVVELQKLIAERSGES